MIKFYINYIIVKFYIFQKFTISFMDSNKFTSVTHTQHSWMVSVSQKKKKTFMDGFSKKKKKKKH